MTREELAIALAERDQPPQNVVPSTTTPRGPMLPEIENPDLISRMLPQRDPRVPLTDLQYQQRMLGFGSTLAPGEKRGFGAIDVPMGSLAQIGEAIEKVDPFSLATAAAPVGGGALTKLAPAMFIGAGAKTADKSLLKVAKGMQKEGKTPGEILDVTSRVDPNTGQMTGLGWFQGADKKWRQEISDQRAKINPEVLASAPVEGESSTNVGWALSSVLDHPEFFKAYPHLANTEVWRLPKGVNYKGVFDPETGRIALNQNLSPEEARSVILHELQHSVQNFEKFAEGGSRNMPLVRRRGKEIEMEVFQNQKERADQITAQLKQYINERGGFAQGQRTQDLANKWMQDNPGLASNLAEAQSMMRNIPEAGRFEAYKRLMGEVEARNTQARADMPIEQRFLKRPETTEDRPRDQQIEFHDRRKKPNLMLSEDRMGSLFDYSKIGEVPDVPQFALPRYAPPRGVSERVSDLVASKKVREKMLEKIEAGTQIGPGAEKFYNNDPLRQAFIEELGRKKGPDAFGRYMDYVAGTSPRSAVPANVRNASYYYTLDRQGKPMPAVGAENPQPYGHMAQRLHQQNAAQIAAEGGWDVMKNPKPASFSQNLQGNFQPVTVDAHAFKLPAMLSRDPEFLANAIKLEKGKPTINPSEMFAKGDLTMKEALSKPVYWTSKPNKNEYAAMEQYYQQLAREAGLPANAMGQAAAWAGGGEITGLKSFAGDPFLRAVENRAILTAKERGITPAEALSQFIRGKAPLLSVGGAAGMGALAAQDQYQ